MKITKREGKRSHLGLDGEYFGCIHHCHSLIVGSFEFLHTLYNLQSQDLFLPNKSLD